MFRLNLFDVSELLVMTPCQTLWNKLVCVWGANSIDQVHEPPHNIRSSDGIFVDLFQLNVDRRRWIGLTLRFSSAICVPTICQCECNTNDRITVCKCACAGWCWYCSFFPSNSLFHPSTRTHTETLSVCLSLCLSPPLSLSLTRTLARSLARADFTSNFINISTIFLRST